MADLVAIIIVAVVFYFIVKNFKRNDTKGNGTMSNNVHDYLFQVNLPSQPLDDAVRNFGKLCNAIVKACPQGKRDKLTIKVAIDRNKVAATLSIDTFEVDLSKILYGRKLVNHFGWEGNDRYLEGKVSSIYLPDSWDGPSITDAIARDFLMGFPNAMVENEYDDIMSTRTAGVIFRAKN